MEERERKRKVLDESRYTKLHHKNSYYVSDKVNRILVLVVVVAASGTVQLDTA